MHIYLYLLDIDFDDIDVEADIDVDDDTARELIMLFATSEARQIDDRLALTICRLLSGHCLDDSMLAVNLSATKSGKTGIDAPMKYSSIRQLVWGRSMLAKSSSVYTDLTDLGFATAS